MRILLKKTRRKRTDSGYYLNESPEVICLNTNTPNNHQEQEDCGCPKCDRSNHRFLIKELSFRKHISECEKRMGKCIPEDTPTYSGEWKEHNQCYECG